jgi:DNA-binding response OmpR family regulator
MDRIGEQAQQNGEAAGAPPTPGEVLRAGPLEVRPAEGIALADGRPLMLTVRELQLLTALARRPERLISRPALHASVWDGPMRAHDRSVDVYVSKLRAKLEAALPGWRYIHTHFGFGYRFSPSPLHDFHSSLTAR